MAAQAIRGRWALVTGASLGIGRDLAALFAAGGVNLVLVARSEKVLQELAADWRAKHGIEVRVIAADLARREAADEVAAAVAAAGIEIEYLVNNAGIGAFGLHHEASLETEQTSIDLNVTTLTRLTKRLLPGMLARRSGRILNVASTAAFQPGPYMAVYYATKAYVLSYSEAIGEELRGTGVTVTALCPGPTASGFQARAAMESSRLVHIKAMMGTSRDVATAGYRAMLAGRSVVIPGIINWLIAESIRFTPRRLATAIVAQLGKPVA